MWAFSWSYIPILYILLFSCFSTIFCGLNTYVHVVVSGNIPKIAFYANKITDYTNLGAHQILNFGNTITNKGNCYHHATGNFIPNVSGVYVFYVHILSSPGHILYTELMVEGAVMGTHYMAQSSYYSNGGGMAVVHVNAGDSVWVRVRTAENGTLIGWESSFSGFLLYPE